MHFRIYDHEEDPDSADSSPNKDVLGEGEESSSSEKPEEVADDGAEDDETEDSKKKPLTLTVRDKSKAAEFELNINDIELEVRSDGTTMTFTGSNNDVTLKGTKNTVSVVGDENKVTYGKEDENKITINGESNTVCATDSEGNVVSEFKNSGVINIQPCNEEGMLKRFFNWCGMGNKPEELNNGNEDDNDGTNTKLHNSNVVHLFDFPSAPRNTLALHLSRSIEANSTSDNSRKRTSIGLGPRASVGMNEIKRNRPNNSK